VSLRFSDELLNTENPFIDLLMYNLKILAFNCVIKNEYDANEAETEESLKNSSIYIACLENKAHIELFDEIPVSFLQQVGMPQSQIDLYVNNGYDKYYIPKDIVWDYNTKDYVPSGTTYEADLKPLLQNWFIAKYENNHYEGELNNYYRKILGIPPVGDWGIPMVEYEYLFPSYFTYTGDFLHEIGPDACKTLDRLGILDIIKADYPDADYLDYVTCGITAYDARNKMDMQILWHPSVEELSYDNEELNVNTFKAMIQEFEDKYIQNREFMQTAVYSQAMEIASTEYHSFMILYTLMITMMDILTEIQSHIIKKDILNRRCVQYILSMYGIPFYRKIPEKFQERIAKNCHTLIKYKASPQGMENIKDIFDAQDIQLYKYYILKARKFDSYGSFAFSESDKLVCGYNDIILHETLKETVGNPPPAQPVPTNLNYTTKYLYEDSVLNMPLDGTYTSGIDDQVLTANATSDALIGGTYAGQAAANFTALTATDYVQRYIRWPFQYFLQKGNVFFVKIGDYILKEGTDFVVYNYNKIRIKKSLMTNPNAVITYEFYYDKDTINEPFDITLDYSLVTKTKKIIGTTSKTYSLKPLPFPTYLTEGNQVIISIGSVWLAENMYTIDVNNQTVTITDNSLDLNGREIYAILIYSKLMRSKYEKHYVAVTSNNQKKFYIPEPYQNYVINENSFYVTAGDTYIAPERYNIVPSTTQGQSYIEFNDNSKFITRRGLLFNFIYNQNAILNKIDLKRKSIIVTVQEHYQSEFDITWPTKNYITSGYLVFVKLFGWYLPKESFSCTNKKLLLLDESLALPAGTQIELVCFYCNKDRTTDAHDNIRIDKDYRIATSDRQKTFNFKVPVKHYDTKFNKIIVDINGNVLESNQYTIDLNHVNTGAVLNITYYYQRPMKDQRVNLTFVYNQDAEYIPVIKQQHIPITSTNHNTFDLDFPFFPYLQSNHDFLVSVGSTLINKSRIHMKDQFTFEVEGLNTKVGRCLTILYIYCSWYKDNPKQGLIVEWKDVPRSKAIDQGINMPTPFKEYVQHGWDYFVSYNNRIELAESKYDVFDETFYTYPSSDLEKGKYGNTITFTFIYLIKPPWVRAITEEDYDQDQDLYFCRMPVLDLYSSKYLRDESKWLGYDPVTLEDGWWDGYQYKKDSHKLIKEKIYDEKWNYARSKYYSIYHEYDVSTYAAYMGYFYSMLYDSVFLEKEINLEIPSLGPDRKFNIAHLFIFMNILTNIYYGLDDFTIDYATNQKKVVGFNFKTNLNTLKLWMKERHFDPKLYNIWDFIIPTSQIMSMSNFANIYMNNMKVYERVIDNMVKAETFKDYQIWRHIKETLFEWDFDFSYFKKNNGVKATTYSEFLRDKDYPLYLVADSIKKIKNEETRIDMIVSYIDDICYILEGYLDKEIVRILASRFPGRSSLHILKYMKYILEFFKSYKIIFRSNGEHMIFGANGKETEDTVIRFNDIMHSVERFQRDEYYTMVENPTTLEHKEIHDYGPWLKEDVDIKEIHVQ